MLKEMRDKRKANSQVQHEPDNDFEATLAEEKKKYDFPLSFFET